jgi:uncharacterized protein YbaR (Trm112 family)
MTSLALAIDPTPLPCDMEDHSEVACPGCHDQLVVHQPDEQAPGRLLGTCPSCSAWYLIDAVAALMVRLPDEGTIRDVGAAPKLRVAPEHVGGDRLTPRASRSRGPRGVRPRAPG